MAFKTFCYGKGTCTEVGQHRAVAYGRTESKNIDKPIALKLVIVVCKRWSLATIKWKIKSMEKRWDNWLNERFNCVLLSLPAIYNFKKLTPSFPILGASLGVYHKDFYLAQFDWSVTWTSFLWGAIFTCRLFLHPPQPCDYWPSHQLRHSNLLSTQTWQRIQWKSLQTKRNAWEEH